MSANPADALEQRRTSAGRGDLDEKLAPALQEMIAGIRRHRETPLLAGFDSFGIVDAAVQSLLVANPDLELDHLRDWKAVKTIFNRLVLAALLDDLNPSEETRGLSNNATGGNTQPPAREQGNGQAIHPWAGWLEHFHSVMQEVHPKAIEIISLRVEGFQNREIAERVELTRRIVGRIVHDMQRAWKTAMERE